MTNRATKKGRPVRTLTATLSTAQREVLIALFRLSRDTLHISAQTLAEEVSCTPTQTGAALVALEGQGLVDATRARLTMKGLVLATQLGAGSGGPRVARKKAVRVAAGQPAVLPVAALPSQPPRAPEPMERRIYEDASIGQLS